MSNSLSVRIKDVYNCKQGTFNGMLNVYMVGADGTRQMIGARGVQLEHPYYYPIEISCRVPKEAQLGTYTLEVEAQDVETGAESTIYVAEDHPITVTNEVVDYKPNLQATKMNFVKNLMNDSTICVDIKNIMNLSSETFAGDVSLALANENNKVLCMLGKPFNPGITLDTYYFKETIGYLKAVIPDSVPDGIYHILAMARQKGFEGWGLIKKYELQGNVITNIDLDLFLIIQIEDGKPSTTSPTSVKRHSTETSRLHLPTTKETFFLPSGNPSASLHFSPTACVAGLPAQSPSKPKCPTPCPTVTTACALQHSKTDSPTGLHSPCLRWKTTPS